MNVKEYFATFIEKMELVPYLFPTELSKVENFSNGLPMDFGPLVKNAETLEAIVQVAKSLIVLFRICTLFVRLIDYWSISI